jgi:hypothetical protein
MTNNLVEIRGKLASLRIDIERDPALRAEFTRDPKAVFAQRGLSEDVYNKTNSEKQIQPSGMVADCAVLTCICTSCGPLSLSIS